METKDEIQAIVGDRTVSIVEVWPQEVYTMAVTLRAAAASSMICGS